MYQNSYNSENSIHFAENIDDFSKKERFFIKKCLNDIAAAQGFYGLADMSISIEDLNRIHGPETVNICVKRGWIGSKPPGCAPISPFHRYPNYSANLMRDDQSIAHCPLSAEFCRPEGCTYCWLTDHGHKTLAALGE